MMVEDYTTEDFLKAMMEEAREEVLAQERVQAIQRARSAKAEGVTTQTIQMLTGLDMETIKNL